jgi:hypothetical protein
MTWTTGAWREVAIGDTVLGGDGYPWRVTEGLINHFGVDGDGANLRVTMERDGAGARTGDVPAAKPVKYQPASPRGLIMSCYACQRGDDSCGHREVRQSSDRLTPGSDLSLKTTNCATPCCVEQTADDYQSCAPSPGKTLKRSAPETAPDMPPTSAGLQSTRDRQEVTKNSVNFCRRCDTATHVCPGCGVPLPHGTEVCEGCDRSDVPMAREAPSSRSSEQAPASEAESISSSSSCPPEIGSPDERREASETGESADSVRAVVATVEPAHGSAPGAPYVEYDDAERAAAVALKGAGFTAQVIERVMTLDGLTSHLGDTHGHVLPSRDTAHGTLIGVEYRAVLADLHFELHAAGQEAGEKWKPRGRTAHTHPVMDRPMENPIPRSWAKSSRKS